MSSVNKAILIGNLGRDPEIRALQDGSKVANLSLATTESWKDKNSGERKERTEWHRITIFGKIAEIAEKYLRKGSKVYLEGQIQTRTWQDQSGNDRYSTEIVLQPFRGVLTMLGDKPNSEEAYRDAAQPSRPRHEKTMGSAHSADDDPDFAASMDDEIPF